MKLTKAQTNGLLSATFNPHARGDKLGAYVIHELHGRTRKSLHDMGLMTGHYYLTRKGVETLAALAGNTVDMYGYTWDGEMIVTDDPYAETVTVQGEYVEPRTMVDPEGNTIPYDAFLSMAMQDAARIEADGGCVGLCAVGTGCEHCDTEYGPATPQISAEDFCNAIESDTGLRYECTRVGAHVEHIATGIDGEALHRWTDNSVIIPKVHALDMGDNAYNRFVGIGVREDGTAYTYGLATAISAHPGMNGTGQTNIPTEFGDVITVATREGNKRFAVRDNRWGVNGEGGRKGDPLLIAYGLDDVRCSVCHTFGDNSTPSKEINGNHVCGYCVDNGRDPMNLETHSLKFYVSTENMGVKYECENCGSIDSRGYFAQWVCAGDDSDAGFVETDSTDDYAIVSRLSTGAGFHTVADSVSTTPVAPVSTGTTHHTMDENGAQWERFDHVLSVGDVVKVVGRQGVYEVHCLIPGLPVVYVLGTQGEPFPVPATDVYAL